MFFQYNNAYKLANLCLNMAVKTLEGTIRGKSIVAPQTQRPYGNKQFSTRSLIITGEMDLKIPGRGAYMGIDSVHVCYQKPMDVDLSGNMSENSEGLLEVNNGRMQITAYRENEAENALDKIKGEIELQIKEIPDPEITLYRGKEQIVLNQVIGIPIINIIRGSVNYSK